MKQEVYYQLQFEKYISRNPQTFYEEVKALGLE